MTRPNVERTWQWLSRSLTRAEAEAARARELTPQVMSVAKLQEAETAGTTARARLQGLRDAHTASSGAQTQPVHVTATMAGVVSVLSIEVGAVVNKGDVLTRILAGGPAWVVVLVAPDEPVGES